MGEEGMTEGRPGVPTEAQPILETEDEICARNYSRRFVAFGSCCSDIG
jgi:hypothetical protein